MDRRAPREFPFCLRRSASGRKQIADASSGPAQGAGRCREPGPQLPPSRHRRHLPACSSAPCRMGPRGPRRVSPSHDGPRLLRGWVHSSCPNSGVHGLDAHPSVMPWWLARSRGRGVLLCSFQPWFWGAPSASPIRSHPLLLSSERGSERGSSSALLPPSANSPPLPPDLSPFPSCLTNSLLLISIASAPHSSGGRAASPWPLAPPSIPGGRAGGFGEPRAGFGLSGGQGTRRCLVPSWNRAPSALSIFYCPGGGTRGQRGAAGSGAGSWLTERGAKGRAGPGRSCSPQPLARDEQEEEKEEEEKEPPQCAVSHLLHGTGGTRRRQRPAQSPGWGQQLRQKVKIRAKAQKPCQKSPLEPSARPPRSQAASAPCPSPRAPPPLAKLQPPAGAGDAC